MIDRDLTDDEFVDLIDRLEYLLCSKGLSEDDLNDLGIMCDEILHKIGSNS